MSRSVLFVWFGILSVSPAFGQSATERQLAADIRILEQRADRVEGAINELTKNVEGLNKQLSELANATRKLAADQMVIHEEAQITVRVLREQLAEMNERLAAVADKSTSPVGATDLFENARGDYMAGNYLLAVDGFTA